MLNTVEKKTLTERCKAEAQLKERFALLTEEQIRLTESCSSRWVALGSALLEEYRQLLVGAVQRALTGEEYLSVRSVVVNAIAIALDRSPSVLKNADDAPPVETTVELPAVLRPFKRAKTATICDESAVLSSTADESFIDSIAQRLMSQLKVEVALLDPTAVRNKWPNMWLEAIEKLAGGRKSLGIELIT